MATAIIWYRRDLRLADHPALQFALEQGLKPVPVYILDASEPLGGAGAWWLHHSLNALQLALRQSGSDLLVYRGDSTALLLQLARAHKAEAVFWNRRYEPQGIARDEAIGTALQQSGLQVRHFAASLLREPETFGKADDSPYRVFTPFWKALQKVGPARAPMPAPESLPKVDSPEPLPLPLAALGLISRIPWHSEFARWHSPGEDTAWRQVENFFAAPVFDYAQNRDFPALAATSGLSAHLHFGEISAPQIWHYAHSWSHRRTETQAISAAETFLRQLAWREFAAHLLFHFPHTDEFPLDPRYRHFPWRKDYQAFLDAWKKGATGIPIVDAGMRELWASGWMHNRVRMIVASLLTKNLLIPWQEGEAWFRDTLVDADAANNCFGWQWTAGSGADAAPYFRIFNPVRQGERFDADGSYVRCWVPELSRLPPKWIHRPWEAPPEVLAAASVRLGDNYPEPLVDLKASRTRALAAWDAIKTLSIKT